MSWGRGKWDYHAGYDPISRSGKGKRNVIFLVEWGSLGDTAINVIDLDMTSLVASHTSIFFFF